MDDKSLSKLTYMKKPSFLGIFKFTLSSAETASNNMTYTWRLRKPCESPEKSPCHLGISNTCSKHLHIFIISMYFVLFSPCAFWFQQKCHFQFWFYKDWKDRHEDDFKFFFSIRAFVHRHWWFTRQQGRHFSKHFSAAGKW